MKLLVMGLDCAAPEILLGSEELPNFRRLMEAGCFGKLESVIPPITVPAWMCMSTSQDPGSLGAYGFRNRTDHTYGGLGVVNAAAFRQLAVWDQVAREGGKAYIVGVPPNYPPRKTSGGSVGCFLTPDPDRDIFAHPAKFTDEIRELVGSYPVDVTGFRTGQKGWLKDSIYEMTRKHFQVLRHILANREWDYLQFVEIGLDRLHHGFWKYHDTQHRQYEAGNPFENVIRDYYRFLDDEVGQLLELLDDETSVLVLSDHGAQRLDGGFCINEWLVREKLLVLNKYPDKVTPMTRLDVNWSETTCWSEGGYYARMFLNVKGREPDGIVDPRDYDKVRDDLKARLQAIPNDRGEPMNTLVFKPEEIYRQVNNIPPDMLVHFDNLYWRSVGGVGYPDVYVQENDTGPDDCNHAQFGAFILAGPLPVQGEVRRAHLLDMAPTLLELGGYDPLPDAQGISLVSGQSGSTGENISAADQDNVRQRLRGLGSL